MFLLVGIILGPKEPKLTINSYFEPLVDKLKEFWFSVNPFNIITAIILWRFGLITNCGIYQTILLNVPYASYCPMRLS